MTFLLHSWFRRAIFIQFLRAAKYMTLHWYWNGVEELALACVGGCELCILEGNIELSMSSRRNSMQMQTATHSGEEEQHLFLKENKRQVWVPLKPGRQWNPIGTGKGPGLRRSSYPGPFILTCPRKDGSEACRRTITAILLPLRTWISPSQREKFSIPKCTRNSEKKILKSREREGGREEWERRRGRG